MERNGFTKIYNASQLNRKEWHLFGEILVYVKDALPKHIDLTQVLNIIEDTIPQHLTCEVDDVFIGQFDEFADRDINSFYANGAIYVTNNQANQEDLVDDIIHEFAHAVEEQSALNIYLDGSIEREFLVKREKLFYKVKSFLQDNPKLARKTKRLALEDFLETSYSKDFDKFLYQIIGYKALSRLTADIFITPYAATSLREYFASGFERYFYGGQNYSLYKVSKNLYKVLDNLYDGDYNGKEQGEYDEV